MLVIPVATADHQSLDGFGSFLSRIGGGVTRVVRAVAPVAAPVAGAVIGGSAGALLLSFNI